MAKDPWNSTAGQRLRLQCFDRDRRANAECHICKGQRGPIDYSVKPSSTPLSWEPDHIKPRSKFPELALKPTNIGPSHRCCNRSKKDRAGLNQLGEPSRRW